MIEMMVTILVITVLVTLAVPTFFSARDRAQDRAAQSSLRSTMATMVILEADNTFAEAQGGGTWGQGQVRDALMEAEPSIDVVAPQVASDSSNTVSFWFRTAGMAAANPTHPRFVAVALSGTGRCFGVELTHDGRTEQITVPDSQACEARRGRSHGTPGW